MTLQIRIGGLLRCCIQTLNMRQRWDAEEGETVECDICASEMIVRDGAWEWKAPERLSDLIEKRNPNRTTPKNGVK